MLDINLGNKTLFVGVLIALILSYGMVNFDTGRGADLVSVPAVSAAVRAERSPADLPLATADAAPVPSANAAPADGNTASAIPSASAAHREKERAANPSASTAQREGEAKASPNSGSSQGKPHFDTIEERRDYYDSRS